MRLLSITLFLAQLGLVVVAKGQRKRKSEDKSSKYIKFEDCGMDPERPVRLTNVTVTPRILRYPGRLKLSLDANVTTTLPQTLSADVIISKYFWGNFIKIPCIKNVGSCHYKQICELLTAYYGRRCPRRLRRQGFPCSCPFKQGQYSLKELRLDIPDIDGVWSFWVNGQYEIMLRLYDESNNDELACMKFTLFLKQRTARNHKSSRRDRTGSGSRRRTLR